MKYAINFFAGEGNHFSGSVNYLRSTDGSIYAEIQVPEEASEDYGYLTMKKAIMNRLPGADIEWWYSQASEANLEADADVNAEVWTDIQVEEDPEDDHPEMEDIPEEEGYLFAVEYGLGNTSRQIENLFKDGTLRLEWDEYDAIFKTHLHYEVDRNAGMVKVYADGHDEITLGIVPCITPEHDDDPDPDRYISRLAMTELIDRTTYALQHGLSRRIPEDITVTDKGLIPQSSLVRYLVNIETDDQTEVIDRINAPEGYTAAQYVKDCEDNAPQAWIDMLHGDDIRRIYLERYNSETSEWEEVEG